jgi:hypothetical protein
VFAITISTEKLSCRVAARLTADHISVLFPDVETPFRDVEDVVDRLLPYHVFQHPWEDLLKAGGKGKRKATETEILQSELEGAPLSSAASTLADDVIISETKFALECFKRRRALEERFRHARTKSGRARQSVPIRIRVLLTVHPSAQRPMIRHITSNDSYSTPNAQSIQHYLLSIAAQNLSWNVLRVCNA